MSLSLEKSNEIDLLIKRKAIRFRIFGGLGDAVILTPILREVKRRNPMVKIILLGGDDCRPVFENNLSVHKFISYRHYSIKRRVRMLFHNEYDYYLNYGNLLPELFSRNIHAVEVTARMMNLTLSNEQIDIHITPEEDKTALAILNNYSNPVLIQITSSGSSNKNWSIEKWNTLVKRMSKKITFIQVGLRSETPVEGTINLLGKTTLRESMALLKNVSSFVTVDSFMNNASNAFLTKGVVLFGASSPIQWGYPNNINLYVKQHCSPCIGIVRGNRCPYDVTCMKQISVENVQAALEKQLIAANGGPIN